MDKGLTMLYSIEMTIQNSRIEIHDIEYLDLEITLTADGGIENIWIDNRSPTSEETIVINDNLREIQYEIGFRWMENEQNKYYGMWAEV